MRRRVREQSGPGAPPLHLARYRGTTLREGLAWIVARKDWWDNTHDEDHPGWLLWLLDGWEQVGDLPFCGATGTPCGSEDCLCAIPPPEPISYLPATRQGA